jgi:hypothetical protein
MRLGFFGDCEAVIEGDRGRGCTALWTDSKWMDLSSWKFHRGTALERKKRNEHWRSASRRLQFIFSPEWQGREGDE